MPSLANGSWLDLVHEQLDAGTFDRVVLASERALEVVCRARPPWLDQVFPRLDPDMWLAATDKRQSISGAAAWGVPAPAYCLPATAEEAAGFANQFPDGTVLKAGRGAGGGLVRRCRSPVEAAAAFADLLALTGETPLIQEYLTGTEYVVGGLFADGQPVSLWAGTVVVRETDPSGRLGASSVVRSTVEPDVVALGTAVFAHLGYSGFGCVDVIRDSAGLARFIEVNLRPWGSMEAAEHAGAKMWRPFVDLFFGFPPPALPPARPGVTVALFKKALASHASGGRWGDVGRALADPWVWRAIMQTSPRYLALGAWDDAVLWRRARVKRRWTAGRSSAPGEGSHRHQ